jgi:UDP-N-acetylmuramoylalanine--D-glutamate ligase
MERMVERLRHLVTGRKIGILGFGLEGQSTYRFLQQHFGDVRIIIADRDAGLAKRIPSDVNMEQAELITGEDYLERLSHPDVLFKSPGIELPSGFTKKNQEQVIVSQTELMLAEYRDQVIGVTGTKGKSTTSSLIHHILAKGGIKNILIGNIGIPPFDTLREVSPDTIIVFELSSHQLERIKVSPHVSILLNLYPEHLDRYNNLEEYYKSKWNIFLHQKDRDHFILYDDIPSHNLPGPDRNHPGQVLRYGLHPVSGEGAYIDSGNVVLTLTGERETCCDLSEGLYMKGQHNRLNMLAAILACRLKGMPTGDIMEGIRSFKGLEHRLEYAGRHRGIDFYNDSIATIPEATVEALKTIPNIGTLILGGYDRGLDYSWFIDYLMDMQLPSIIFMGKAGERMHLLAAGHRHSTDHRLFLAANMQEAFDIILRETPAGSSCLLSPAAASYDSFKNFEERGRLFKQLARSL